MDFFGGSEDVGRRVTRLREKKGWSYGQLSDETERAGTRVSKSVLYRIENGATGGQWPRVSVDDLVALCRVFGVDPGDMLTAADVLDTRLAERLRDDIRVADQTMWSAAQAFYDAIARISIVSGGRDRERSDELLEFVVSQVGQSGGDRDAFHPAVATAVLGALSEIVHEAAAYESREQRREVEITAREAALKEAAEILATIEAAPEWARPPDLVAQSREAVASATDRLESRRAAHDASRQWEAEHPVLRYDGMEGQR